nr:hypothetical protein [Arthrobacter yangruifuii]
MPQIQGQPCDERAKGRSSKLIHIDLNSDARRVRTYPRCLKQETSRPAGGIQDSILGIYVQQGRSQGTKTWIGARYQVLGPCAIEHVVQGIF